LERSGKRQLHSHSQSAFFVSDEIVDDVLRTGSGRKNTLFHITAKLVEGIDHEELRRFLIQEYGTGGKGLSFPTRNSASGMTGTGCVSDEGIRKTQL